MSLFEVRLYEQDNGNCPVVEFIDSLSAKEKAKILRDIDLLEELGIKAREPLVKSIKGEKNLYELRSIFGNNAQRIFYFLFDGHQFILLNGFTKKTEKTPRSEIEKAKNYKEDYLSKH
jgi:phage-related protein